MRSVQRFFLIALIFLAYPVYADYPAETITISSTVIGVTDTLCKGGTPQSPTYGDVIIVVLDQPIWYTFDGPTTTPGPTVGALAPAGTIIRDVRADYFRAVRQGSTDARLYIVCFPQ